MISKNYTIEVSRSDYATTRLFEEDRIALSSGRVRFRVDHFALTANNVTYAVVGDMLGYWDFFPAQRGWGRIPCMGWGEVIESAHDDVEPGNRYYGWFPMARTIDMTVTPIELGLRDDGAHRAAHAAPYRAYVAHDRDPFYEEGADGEARQALLRGLFMTGFLADDFFGVNDFFGAANLIVLSASSKTGIALATCTAKRDLNEIVACTSAANAEFCGKLDCYDRIVTYDALDNLAIDGDAVVVDIAGSAAYLEKIHRALGDRLKYSMTIGMSHHDADRSEPPSVGPTPELFFAPTQMEQRMADWGPEGYRTRITQALFAFTKDSHAWLEVERLGGTAGAKEAWDALIEGKVPPDTGQIVTLWGEDL